MLALSKAGHEKFCRVVEEVIARQRKENEEVAETLASLESELENIFQSYQYFLNDIKIRIVEYDMKQKEIRMIMKKMIRHYEVSKK